MFSFSALEGKHPQLVEAAASCRKLRDVLKDFDFSDLPHTDKSPAYKIVRNPKGYTEVPATDPEKRKQRRLSNIKCKAGLNKNGLECGKPMSRWSSYKTHLKDFHTDGTNGTTKQWIWPKGAKRPTKPVHGPNEHEAEQEMVTCYLCNPHKELASNRFNHHYGGGFGDSWGEHENVPNMQGWTLMVLRSPSHRKHCEA